MRKLTFTLAITAALAAGAALAQESDDGEATQATTPIEELTPEEIEAELKRAQELLDDPDAPSEFKQSKPLPADIAIDLPSDI